MKRTVDMTSGSPTRHILKFAFPLIITNIGQQLYMIVDAAIVGRGVGVDALAAVGAKDWSYWIILWTVTGITQGFATFVSRYFGDKNYKAMNRAIATSVVLCAVIGSVLTVAGIFAARPVLTLLNTPTEIIDDANIYLVTMISGTLVVAAYNMAASILRAFGDGKTPLIAMVIAALLNIGLDCLFVFVFDMEIFGAALASVLSQAVSFVYCVICIKKIDCIELTRDCWRPDGARIKNMLLLGTPVALQNMVLALGGVILQSSINLQGRIFIAGYTATNKVYGLMESCAVSVGMACATFLSQNYGAGLRDRVKQGTAAAVRIVTVMAVAIIGLLLLVKRPLLTLFLDTSEEGAALALDKAVRYLTIMACFLVILYYLHVFRNALLAMEIGKWSMISGISEFFSRAIMSKVVINYIGSDALFISEPVAWLGSMLCVMLPYFYYRSKLLTGGKEKELT